MQSTHSTRLRSSGSWLSVLPFSLALCGCDAVPDDDAPLRTLARDELIGLCDDLEDELLNGTLYLCPDGGTGFVVPPSDHSCRVLDLSECDATAGDLRACHRAAALDPCAAMHTVPEACLPLWSRGCMPSITASPGIAYCPEASPLELDRFEGIYEIVRHTENVSYCSAEGDSVLSRDSQRLLLVTPYVTFSGALVNIVEACGDLADCRRRNQEILQGSLGVDLSEQPERSFGCDLGLPDAVHGELLRVQLNDDGTCTGSLIETTATLSDAGILRLEERTKYWSTSEALGDCNFDSGDPPVRAAECSALEVYEARLLSEI